MIPLVVLELYYHILIKMVLETVPTASKFLVVILQVLHFILKTT